MVSTRHHPRPFPEPTLAPSRTPGKETSVSTSSSPTKTSPPPSPTVDVPPPKRTPGRRPGRKSTTADAVAPNANDSNSSTALTRTRSRRRTRSQIRGRIYSHRPKSLIITWLLGSLILVFWDTGYVLGRPHTMPGGRYHNPIWTPYALYGTIDYVYGWPQWNRGNGFTAAQASLNVFESIMYIYYLFVVFTGVAEGWREGVFGKLWREKSQGHIVVEGPEVATAVLVCCASAVMTVSKTVLYALNEVFSNFDNVGHNDARTLIFLWIIPNGAWIVFPTYMTYVFSKEIISAMNVAGESGEKED